jgi:NADPH:quinone reductase-like Zn-dependent oxidoreductase
MVKTRTTIFTGPKQLEVREVELPEVGPHQVLVKVRACALCTWEQRFYKGSSPQDYPFRGGHEVSGEVVAGVTGCMRCPGGRPRLGGHHDPLWSV